MSIIQSNFNDTEKLIFSEINFLSSKELSNVIQKTNDFFNDSQDFKFPWQNIIFCHKTMFDNIDEKEFKFVLEKLFNNVELIGATSIRKVMESSNKNFDFGKMPVFSMEKTYALIEDIYTKTESIVDVFKVLKELGPPEPTFKFRLNNLERYVNEVNIKFGFFNNHKVIKRKINRF